MLYDTGDGMPAQYRAGRTESRRYNGRHGAGCHGVKIVMAVERGSIIDDTAAHSLKRQPGRRRFAIGGGRLGP
jgi:hypothetical protein